MTIYFFSPYRRSRDSLAVLKKPPLLFTLVHSKVLRELHLSKPFNTSRSTPQAQELKIETIQGKPLGCGHVTYGSPPVTLQVGCFHRETISFLVLDGPTVNIILGRPWLSQHSPDGVPARSCDGVNPVSRTVILMFQHSWYFLPVSKLTPPSWRAPNLSRNMQSHLTMWRSRMCSANRQSHRYPLIVHGTAS